MMQRGLLNPFSCINYKENQIIMHDRLKPLVSLPFFICLVLLITNDFFLKATFHNTLTGKLSDCCGLFIFPIFWSVLFPKNKVWLFILTGILFIYWKSEYAAPFIEFFSTYLYSVQRIVDPTDLIALPVLYLAWLSLKDDWGSISIAPFLQKMSSYVIALVTIFSFCTTTMAHYVQSFDQPQYVLFRSNKMPDSTSYQEDVKLYQFDSLLVVEVKQLYDAHKPGKDDDYNKNLMIKNLDKDVFGMFPGIKGLMPAGKLSALTISTSQYQDFLRFNGNRLDGQFIRKKGEKILIEGYYKMGIEDSTWTFRDINSSTVTKKTFLNGERTKVQYFVGDKLVSSESIHTRAGTIRNKYIVAVILFLLMIGTIVLLVRNYRRNDREKFQITLGWKWLLCFILPILVWLAQLMMGQVLSDYGEDIFYWAGMFFMIYIITCPLFFIIVFGIKLREQIDMLWYCLFFALLISLLMECAIISKLN